VRHEVRHEATIRHEGGCGVPEEIDAEASRHAGSDPFGVDCDEAVHQLYHYLDGELTDERRREIARHLDLCEPCAGAAGFEAELRVVIASHCRDRVPDALIRRIADAIHDEERRHSDTA
jgi:mycothiol system anti-sigma-R factor